ncbi:hypothetical protein TVB01_16150, partial [Arthrobacter sp. 7Tela_A1]
MGQITSASGESLGGTQGALFDIDETLVDLRTAMGNTLREISAADLAHFTEEDWAAYQHLYAADPQGYYDKYLAGELSFTRQPAPRRPRPPPPPPPPRGARPPHP